MLYVTSTARSDYRNIDHTRKFCFICNPFFVPSLSMEVNRISLPSLFHFFCQIKLIPGTFLPQMNNPSTVNLLVIHQPHNQTVPNH
jgi:hypothetical protein